MFTDQEQRSLRATFVQQGIWLNELRTGMHDAYHLPFIISIDGELDTASLVTACMALLDRHRVLAQAFSENDGVAYAVPAECAPRLVQADLSGLPSGEREAELRDQLRRTIEQPFDLRKGPLVRMTLYSLDESRHALLVVAHHLVFDGQSMDLFARDLLRLYELALSGAEPVLPELRHSADEYAAAEERQLAAILPDARRFWRARWQEPPQMLLPGVTEPIGTVDAGGQVEFSIDGDRRARLLEVCQNLGITEFDLLLASLHCLLYRYGNDLPVVTIALGFRPAEYDDNIGSFAQELPFALAVEKGSAFNDFAIGLHANLRELYQFRMVPLNRAMAGVRPSALHTAIALSYRRAERDKQIFSLRTRARRLHNSWVRGALSALVYSDDSALDFLIGYSGRVLTQEAAQRIADHWVQVIEYVTANPNGRIDSFPLPGADDEDLNVAGRQEAAAHDDTPLTGFVPGVAAAADVEKIGRIWRQILKVGDIGPEDDLFDFGVDSLVVNQISLAIYREFNVDIPLEVFYDYPTISGIANVIARARQEG